MDVVAEDVELIATAREVTRLWWVFLVTGIAWVLIAFMVLAFKPTTPATIGYLTGFVLIAAGVNEFMTIGDAAGVASYDPSTTEFKINYAMTPAIAQNAYYGRPASAFGPWARDYCNKCHAKD